MSDCCREDSSVKTIARAVRSRLMKGRRGRLLTGLGTAEQQDGAHFGDATRWSTRGACGCLLFRLFMVVSSQLSAIDEHHWRVLHKQNLKFGASLDAVFCQGKVLDERNLMVVLSRTLPEVQQTSRYRSSWSTSVFCRRQNLGHLALGQCTVPPLSFSARSCGIPLGRGHSPQPDRALMSLP